MELYLSGGFAINAYLTNITGEHKDMPVSFDNMKDCIQYLKLK